MKNKKNNHLDADILTHYPTRNGKRYFAAASTGEEADGKLPSLEEAAARWGEQPRDIEDILQNGDITDLGRLNWSNADLGWYNGMEDRCLTADQQRRLSKAVSELTTGSRHAQTAFEVGVDEQPSLILTANEVMTSYRSYQAAFACLAKVLNAREDAKIMVSVGNAVLLGFQTKEERNAAAVLFTDLQKVYVQYDTERGEFRVDDEAAHKDAVREAKEVEAYLSALKANAIIAVEEVNASEFKYLPISGQIAIESAVTEKYARFLVKTTKYFRSSLNQAKAEGKQITAEMEKWAVIPDFYEIEPYEPILASSRKRLSYSAKMKKERMQK